MKFLILAAFVLILGCDRETCLQRMTREECSGLPEKTSEERTDKAACDVGAFLACDQNDNNYRKARKYINELNEKEANGKRN